MPNQSTATDGTERKKTPRTKARRVVPSLDSLPPPVLRVAALGPKCKTALTNFYREYGDQPQLTQTEALAEGLAELGRAFDTASWTDEAAAHVLATFLEGVTSKRATLATDVRRWILSHPDNPDAVLDCMKIEPPTEVTVVRLLSRAGSQKLVFLGTWHLRQRQVVLKKLLIDDAQVIGREAQAHPLSLRHPNIIETHQLANRGGEVFLVEDYLPNILDDKWVAPGIEEAANLLHDIASALAYLHGIGLIHGDIKPDNVGMRRTSYVLLDFGICRPSGEFTPELTATGSLRTRAPELFEAKGYSGDPEKVDVWALAATVFKTLVGRFPLFDFDEPVPRVSNAEERSFFESILSQRVEKEWAKYLNFSKIQGGPLRILLEEMLQRNPANRPTAKEIVDRAPRELSAFLRNIGATENFSPLEVLDQLMKQIRGIHDFGLVPSGVKQQMRERVEDLRGAPGWTEEQKNTLDELSKTLSAS